MALRSQRQVISEFRASQGYTEKKTKNTRGKSMLRHLGIKILKPSLAGYGGSQQKSLQVES